MPSARTNPATQATPARRTRDLGLLSIEPTLSRPMGSGIPKKRSGPRRLAPEPAHDLDVLLRGRMPLEPGSLEDRGDFLEAGLAEERADSLPADLPLAEGDVAVAVRAALVPGVVDVKQPELLDADLGIDLVGNLAHALG